MSIELPLWEDQINSNEWIKLCNYVFNETGEPWATEQAEKNGLTIFRDKSGIGKYGVIFCGTTQNLLDLFRAIPEDGNYILVTRDIDVRIDHDYFDIRPRSIKHWFAINCQLCHPEITAIPYGCNSVLGFSKTLANIAQEQHDKITDKLIYCRLTIPSELKYPHQRHICTERLEENPMATVIWRPVDAIENFTQMKRHLFVAAPIGVGDDCLRMCESIILGSIPILTDCATTRQFSDLPVCFISDWNIRLDFLMNATNDALTKSTRRIRMSYWANELNSKKRQHDIRY